MTDAQILSCLPTTWLVYSYLVCICLMIFCQQNDTYAAVFNNFYRKYRWTHKVNKQTLQTIGTPDHVLGKTLVRANGLGIIRNYTVKTIGSWRSNSTQIDCDNHRELVDSDSTEEDRCFAGPKGRYLRLS